MLPQPHAFRDDVVVADPALLVVAYTRHNTVLGGVVDGNQPAVTETVAVRGGLCVRQHTAFVEQVTAFCVVEIRIPISAVGWTRCYRWIR